MRPGPPRWQRLQWPAHARTSLRLATSSDSDGPQVSRCNAPACRTVADAGTRSGRSEHHRVMLAPSEGLGPRPGPSSGTVHRLQFNNTWSGPSNLRQARSLDLVFFLPAIITRTVNNLKPQQLGPWGCESPPGPPAAVVPGPRQPRPSLRPELWARERSPASFRRSC